MGQNIKAHLAIFFVNALYGAGHLIAKGVMPEYLSAASFIWLRVSSAVILFWLLLSLKGLERIAWKDVPHFIACGFFGVALNQLCFFHGLELSSAINSGIIMTLNPMIVLILAAIFLREKITVRKLFGIVLAAGGAIFLTLNGGSFSKDSIFGDLLLLINATSYAVYLIISKPLTQKYKPLTVITWVFTFGWFFVSAFPGAARGFFDVSWSSLPTMIWSKIIYIVLGITFLAYLMTIYALKYLKASSTSSYIYFQPLFVIVFSYLFYYLSLTEDYTGAITFSRIAAMMFILFGVWLSTRESYK